MEGDHQKSLMGDSLLQSLIRNDGYFGQPQRSLASPPQSLNAMSLLPMAQSHVQQLAQVPLPKSFKQPNVNPQQQSNQDLLLSQLLVIVKSLSQSRIAQQGAEQPSFLSNSHHHHHHHYAQHAMNETPQQAPKQSMNVMDRLHWLSYGMAPSGVYATAAAAANNNNAHARSSSLPGAVQYAPGFLRSRGTPDGIPEMSFEAPNFGETDSQLTAFQAQKKVAQKALPQQEAVSAAKAPQGSTRGVDKSKYEQCKHRNVYKIFGEDLTRHVLTDAHMNKVVRETFPDESAYKQFIDWLTQKDGLNKLSTKKILKTAWEIDAESDDEAMKAKKRLLLRLSWMYYFEGYAENHLKNSRKINDENRAMYQKFINQFQTTLNEHKELGKRWNRKKIVV